MQYVSLGLSILTVVFCVLTFFFNRNDNTKQDGKEDKEEAKSTQYKMYSPTSTTFTANTKYPMRPFASTYSAESNVDTYVNIYASSDVSGYMVLYYAYA